MTQEEVNTLVETIDCWIKEACKDESLANDSVNFSDLRVVDVIAERNIMWAPDTINIRVIIEEADPGCLLVQRLNERLKRENFATNVYITTEW